MLQELQINTLTETSETCFLQQMSNFKVDGMLYVFNTVFVYKNTFRTNYYLKSRQPTTATELRRAADIHRFKPHTRQHV